jgi:hypothetical protein
MTPHLLHLLRSLWRARIDSFREIFVFITLATAVSVAWVVKNAPIRAFEKHGCASPPRPPHGHVSIGTLAALTLAITILAGYIAIVFKWEDFADYDDAFFTLFTLRGQPLTPPIWPQLGRFFPLGRLEFNLMRHITSSVAGYHAVPIVQLVILAFILFLLDDMLTAGARLALVSLCLLLPSVVNNFTGLVYPDRNVVFWLVCLAFFIKLFDDTRSTVCAIAATICAQNMLYNKETAFLLLLGFAAGRIISRCWNATEKVWDRNRLRDKESRLDLCLLGLVLIYLVYYVSAMMPHLNIQYADEYRVPWSQALAYVLRLDLLGFVMVAAFLRRIYVIARGRSLPSPFWDGLAFGGVACFGAYVYLRLCRPYYFAPIDVIAVMYLGRLAVLSWEKLHFWSKSAALATGVAVVLQCVSVSAFYVYERENVIHAKSELASTIVTESRSDAGHVQRLFFPFSTVYPMTEFASYLVYRGVRLEGYDTSPAAAPSAEVVIVSKNFVKDGPCVDYRDFVCHAAREPAPGDLVIELPDDLESENDIGPYRAHGILSFSYEPRPRLPDWMDPLLSFGRVASIRWRFTELPDRWLHASMTVWR